jgi:hypothetical protein
LHPLAQIVVYSHEADLFKLTVPQFQQLWQMQITPEMVIRMQAYQQFELFRCLSL